MTRFHNQALVNESSTSGSLDQTGQDRATKLTDKLGKTAPAMCGSSGWLGYTGAGCNQAGVAGFRCNQCTDNTGCPPNKICYLGTGNLAYSDAVTGAPTKNLVRLLLALDHPSHSCTASAE